MDYGVMLKKLHTNPSRRSAHHARQSTFRGSDRQIRGAIIRALTRTSQLAVKNLFKLLAEELSSSDSERFEKILDQLCKEELVQRSKDIVSIG